MEQVLDVAGTDAATLAEAGFPALLVENFGDAPFRAGGVESETVAGLTLAVAAVRRDRVIPVGVNVLRNDALAALGIAAATGAAFIRVNVLTGVMYTDQGPIAGRAADLLRRRVLLAPEVEIWADIMVKHATPPAGLTAEQAAKDTVERGLADAVIVSGAGTGAEPDLEEAAMIAGAVPKGTRVVVGSGATPGNLGRLLEVVDSVIVGSALKADGDPGRPVDPGLATAFAEAAARHGLV
jgi:hypothetical protein